MTELAQQLSDEHQRVIKRFAQNPYIDLSFSDGDPPRKYELKYKIKGGVRQGDGSVKIQAEHRVALLLPFGYPNFPPNCKPLTPVYHPDFDPAAICISAFWSKSKSLPGLIIFIGQMIAGQVFGTDNAFNPEAAKWYKENQDRLPFDSVDLDEVDCVLEIDDVGGSLQAGEEPECIDLNLEDSELPSHEEVDQIICDQPLLDEQDLSVESSGLDVDLRRNIDEPEAPFLQNGSSPEGSHPLSLADLPPDDGETETGQPAEVLARLYAEKQRDKRKAIIRLVVGIGLCLAFLGTGFFLASDIKRYNKAEKLWSDVDPLLPQQKYKEIQVLGTQALAEIGKILILKKSAAEKIKQEIDTLFQTEEFRGGLAGKILYEGGYVKKETIPVRESLKAALEEANGAMITEKWETALLYYQEAQKLAQSIALEDKDISDTLEKGIAQSRLQLLWEKGKANLAEDKLDEAVTSLQKAAELANKGVDITPERRVEIHQSLEKALLRKFIKEGEGAFTAIQLDKALNSFNQALLLAEKEASAAPEYGDEIRRSIQQIKLYQLLEKGKLEYEALQLGQALVSFQEALRFIVEGTFGHTEISANEAAIRRKILQITVLVNENKAQAYKQEKNLREALKEYQHIVELLQKSPYGSEREFVEKTEHAREEIAFLSLEVDIAKKRDYLTENYQKIFQENHSLARSATLRNPIVTFVERDGNTQLYSLKCTGYTTTGKISLELRYLYDGGAKTWALDNKR